jgi:hypothetical protein
MCKSCRPTGGSGRGAAVRECCERRERAGSGRRSKRPPARATRDIPANQFEGLISIDADKLVYYDKEHKEIYTGNVDTVVKLAAQVDQTPRCLCATTNRQMDRWQGPSAHRTRRWHFLDEILPDMPFQLKPIQVDGGSGFVLVPGSKLSPAESASSIQSLRAAGARAKTNGHKRSCGP